jgi:hypothetical protein
METFADIMARALGGVGNDKALASVADDVVALCRKFPLGF